jgi:hypothetical protein
MTRTVATHEAARALPIRWTEGQVLAVLGQALKYWVNTCVPHVFLSPSNREMDLAIVTPSRRLWCVEIKTSLADWKRDLDKSDYPASVKPTRFYYAIPESLVRLTPDPRCAARLIPQVPEWVPPHAGILWLANHRSIHAETDGHISVTDHPTTMRAMRPAKSIHRRPLTDSQYHELLRKLGHNYWRHVVGVGYPDAIEINEETHTAVPESKVQPPSE